MFYELLSRKSPSSSPIKTSTKILQIKMVEAKGVVSRKVSFEAVDNRDLLNKFNANDFKLQNILALGAYDVLKPQTMTDTNPLSVIDSFEGAISRTFGELMPQSSQTEKSDKK